MQECAGKLRYFQVHFDPGINECAGNISNTEELSDETRKAL